MFMYVNEKIPSCPIFVRFIVFIEKVLDNSFAKLWALSFLLKGRIPEIKKTWIIVCKGDMWYSCHLSCHCDQ